MIRLSLILLFFIKSKTFKLYLVPIWLTIQWIYLQMKRNHQAEGGLNFKLPS